MSLSLGGPERWRASPPTCSVLGTPTAVGSTLGTPRTRGRPGADVIEGAFGQMMITPAASMRTMSLEFSICLIR